MKNLVMQSARNITVNAPYDVAGGDGCLVGSLFGIASTTVVSGKPVAIDTGGAYAIKKTAAQTFTVGAKVYWDNTAKSVTSVSTDNTLIGVAIKAAAGGDATATVKLGIVA